MYKVLYLTSSSYSGSTLFTFLVNQHPEIFSIGELEGWDYGGKEFKCSCDRRIEECQFFDQMADEYQINTLPFSTRNFGTKLILSRNRQLNRYLTSGMPYLSNTFLEQVRDSILRNIPYYKEKFERAKRANVLFVKKSLEYSGANVFMDATKNPYRLRFLSTISEFELDVLYMIRDFRGVVASNIRKKNMDVKIAMNQWLHEQETILRVTTEYPHTFRLYYEDLCKNTNNSLNIIYKMMGLKESNYEGNIRQGEHHILGNTMRISNVNDITLDQRWRTELSQKQIDLIYLIAEQYINHGKSIELKKIVQRYMNS